MRRRVSFRLECARGSTSPAEFPRDIAGICQSILRRASEWTNERTNEQVSELSNSAKVARRLWKLMSRTVCARPCPGISSVSRPHFCRRYYRVYRSLLLTPRNGIVLGRERFLMGYTGASYRIRIESLFLHLNSSSPPSSRALPFLERREYLMILAESAEHNYPRCSKNWRTVESNGLISYF